MRLIIFINLPDSVESIPFDVIDDQPCNKLRKDVLQFTNKVDGSNDTHYCLYRNGKMLNHNVKLSENGVKNGDQLDLVYTTYKMDSNIDVNISDAKPAITIQESLVDPVKVSPKTSKKKQPMPGKKIDFN